MPEHRPAPELKAQAEALLDRRLDRVRVVTDTSEFMELGLGDLLELDGRRVLIKGVTYEGRFGLDEEPKHWVKRAVDWETGAPLIVKLVFYEEFDLPIGHFKVRCFRSPRKESAILDLVRGMPHFMQGTTNPDAKGNAVRVLDLVKGGPIEPSLDKLGGTHEEYTAQHLGPALDKLMDAFRGIAFLHAHGQRHGDIRRDHLFEDAVTGLYTWIDFDYNFEFRENPFGLDLFGLGNVLCHVVGRGIPTVAELKREKPKVFDRLETGDLSLIIPNRVFNLGKVYPYLPASLVRVVMHFAASTPVFYERVEEILEELAAARSELPA